jgi:hypothetical protein
LLSIVALHGTARCVTMVDFFSPPVQQTPPLVGKLTGVDDPTKYKLLVLVSGDTVFWHDKTHLMPSGNYAQGGEGLPIAADGSFSAANWQTVPLNTYELTTPFLGIWVVPTTFDARWAQPDGTPIYQVETAPIPQKVKDAMICYVIKNRSNEVVKRWPEVSAVRPIQPGLKNTEMNFKNTQNQSPANLYTATGKKCSMQIRTAQQLVAVFTLPLLRKTAPAQLSG